LSKNPIQWAEQVREFLGEVQIEVKKVTWPTQKETVAGTVSVVVVVAIVSVALFGVDSVLAWTMSMLLPR
jgi:preprotein translocase subunit SecE